MRQISSHAVYLLLKLVRENPFMRPVVAKEVQQLLVRGELPVKTVYYGTCFLNQLEFSADDKQFAGELVAFYFSLFRKYATLTLQAEHAKTKRKSPKKPVVKEDPNATRLKLLSAILTGINRAMPYGEGTCEWRKSGLVSEETLGAQLNTLYRIAHCDNWACAVQAMLLLFAIASAHRRSPAGMSA